MATRRLRVASVTLLAGVISACGGGPPAAPTPQPTATSLRTFAPLPTGAPGPSRGAAVLLPELLQRAIETTAGAETARVTFVVQSVAAGSQRHEITGDALISTAPVGAHLRMEVDGLPNLELVVDAGRFYLRGPSYDAWLAPGQWLLVERESDDPVAAGLVAAMEAQIDPWAQLFVLYGASRAPSNLPTELVDGVRTQHYSLTIDPTSIVAHSPPASIESVSRWVDGYRTQADDRPFEVDVWVGPDDHIRRIAFDFSLGSGGVGLLAARYDYSEFGATLTLPVIPAADVVRIEDINL